MPKIVQALAVELLRSGQTHHLDAVVEEISRELLRQRKSLQARVTSARTLPPATLQTIKKTLQDLTAAHTVHLDLVVDPAVLGGIVIRTPLTEINASIASTLKQLTRT